MDEAPALLEWIKEQINEIDDRRDHITPRCMSQAGLKIMEVLKLLPMTNCKLCGREKLQPYLESRGWRALDAD